MLFHSFPTEVLRLADISFLRQTFCPLQPRRLCYVRQLGPNMGQLNLDVLREICGFLMDVPDVLSFSLTCSTLRPIAVERRLSMRDITIWSATSIRDVYNFVFVDEKRRGQHIRAITIPVYSDIPPEPSDELINVLVSVLASATHVRKFSFYLPVPDDWSAAEDPDGLEALCLFCHRRILSAVAQITSLHELRVVAPTDTAGYFLRSTRSALKVFRYGDVEGPRDTPEQFPVTVAPQMIPTLQEIAMTFELFELAMKSMPHMSLSAVRSVTLTDVFRPFKLDMLLTAFPNLDGTLIIGDHLSTFDRERLLRFRGENHDAQKRHAWKALDRVAAGAVMLYALGLTCPIRHLTLNHAPVLIPRRPQPEASGFARAVLQDSSSSRLVLVGVRLPLGNSVLGDSLFAEDTAARLTHLGLDAKYAGPRRVVPIPGSGWQPSPAEGEGLSWDAVLVSSLCLECFPGYTYGLVSYYMTPQDALVAGLEILRLTCIHVAISCDMEASWEPYSVAICDGIRLFKFDCLLGALPSAMPSLTHIVITSSGDLSNVETGESETWKTCRAWRVRRPSGETAGELLESHELEELSAGEAEAVIAREELYATTKTEVCPMLTSLFSRPLAVILMFW